MHQWTTYIWPMRWKIAQWFEQRWWKSYLNDKSPTDYLKWKQAYWRDFLSQLHFPTPQDQSILDAGCGPTGIFIHLNGNKVTATDPLVDTYENQLDHFKKSNYPWVDFQPKLIEELEFIQKFDLVCCINVINHVQNIDRSYHNLVSALKVGGNIILSIDSHNFILPKLLFKLLPLDVLHPHQYALNEYEDHLKERGIKIKQSVKLKSGLLFDYYAIVGEKV